MSLKQLLGIAAYFCLLVSNLACAPMLDSGGANSSSLGNRFTSDQINQSNQNNQNNGRTSYSATATTRDGRQVYLSNGTWEWGPSGGQDMQARMPDGRIVYLHPDGTWSAQRYGFNVSGESRRRSGPRSTPTPKPSPTPLPPSFLHIYQEDGGFGRATVYLNGDAIAHLRENRYFVIRVQPGTHILNIAKPDQGALRVVAAPGRHYYIKNCECFDGWGERLRIMGVNEAQNEIRKARPINGGDILHYEMFVDPPTSN